MKNQNALDNRDLSYTRTSYNMSDNSFVVYEKSIHLARICRCDYNLPFSNLLVTRKEKIELLIDVSKSEKIRAQQIVASACIALERKIKNLYAR